MTEEKWFINSPTWGDETVVCDTYGQAKTKAVKFINDLEPGDEIFIYKGYIKAKYSIPEVCYQFEEF